MKKRLLFSLYFLLVATFLFAELITSKTWGYSIDLPEGFKVVDSKSNSRLILENTILPVTLQISLDKKSKFKDEKEVNESIAKKLNGQQKNINFVWCGKQVQLSNIKFQASNGHNQQVDYIAWVLSAPLDNDRGWITLTTFSPTSNNKQLEPMMISALDSLFIGNGSFFAPGPITTAFFPKTKFIKTTHQFNNSVITFFNDENDAEANKSVVEREFSLLTNYANTGFVQNAWARYYRVIFRDAWQRMESLAFAIKNVLIDNNSNIDEYKIASEVLKYLQNFTYIRDPQGSDFVNIPQCSISKLGDCDSRALLMCILLKQMNIDCILAVSPEFSHAMTAVDCKGPGARFNFNGKRYLVAETTAKVEMGKIAKDIAKESKWFFVELYSLASK